MLTGAIGGTARPAADAAASCCCQSKHPSWGRPFAWQPSPVLPAPSHPSTACISPFCCLQMKALQRAVGGARAAAALRPGLRPVQRRGLRQAPVQALLEQVVTTEDERLRVAEVAAALDKRLARDTAGGGNGGGNDYSTAAAATEQSVSPGDDDRTRFQLHWSVDMVSLTLHGMLFCCMGMRAMCRVAWCAACAGCSNLCHTFSAAEGQRWL